MGNPWRKVCLLMLQQCIKTNLCQLQISLFFQLCYCEDSHMHRKGLQVLTCLAVPMVHYLEIGLGLQMIFPVPSEHIKFPMPAMTMVIQLQEGSVFVQTG